MAPSLQQEFTAALERLVADAQRDRTVLAAILCGSLAYDTVWSKSDIDVVFVTADERKPDRSEVTLDASGIPVHAFLLPRSEFRKAAEGSLHHSVMHSFLARGRVLFTHDPTISELLERVTDLGARDTQVQLLRAGTAALPSIDKARKWFVTRGDLEYSALWVLFAAAPLARIEVARRGLLADREVLPQALALNPPFFKTIYTDVLNVRKTRAGTEAALDAIAAYLRERTPEIFGLVLDHLRDVGEARACTELEDHFARHYGVSGVTTACEYLAAEGRIGKASMPVRLTRRSTAELQELAFFALASPVAGNGRRS